MSRLEAAIGEGRFVVTAELLTVNGGGLDAVRERFAPYEEWVDAVNATDNTSAHAHASSVGVAIALERLGMEPVMQLVCRDTHASTSSSGGACRYRSDGRLGPGGENYVVCTRYGDKIVCAISCCAAW